MDEHMGQMMNQLKQNPAMLQSLMQSHDGQLLMQLLTQDDHGAGLQRAVQSAMRGDTSGMVELVNRINHTAQGAEVINRINRSIPK